MNPSLTIEILILAAGGSSRLGRPKQLLPYGHSSLLRHLTQQAVRSKAERVRVIVGAERTLIENEIDDLDVTVVQNTRWMDGISTSIQAGLATIPETTGGVIIMLSDMPSVTTTHLNALIDTQQEREMGIVASRYADAPGVPALFMRRYFPDLLDLRGDKGAKALLRARAGDLVGVELPGGEVDIDTENDVHTYMRDDRTD